MKPQRLKIDGRVYEKPLASRVVRVMEVCDKLKYGEALSVRALKERIAFNNSCSIASSESFGPRDREEINKRRFRVSHHIEIWAHPKTIEALKNGKLTI